MLIEDVPVWLETPVTWSPVDCPNYHKIQCFIFCVVILRLWHVQDHSVAIRPEHKVYIWSLQSESFSHTSTHHCNDIIIIWCSYPHNLRDAPRLSADGHLYGDPTIWYNPYKQVLESCLTGRKIHLLSIHLFVRKSHPLQNILNLSFNTCTCARVNIRTIIWLICKLFVSSNN